MLMYAILMFMVAIAFAIIAILIYKGKTNLIHDYHQTKVKDKAAYGKAFGKAMGIFAGTMLVSGVVSLFSEKGLIYAVMLLLLGILLGLFTILRVQKKFNGGLF